MSSSTLPRVVILAGGQGTRLAPFTSILPKPLMPVGGHSILELILTDLGIAGFRDVTLCVGYLAHLIEAVVEGGYAYRDRFHVRYVREDAALGTAGPLRLVEGLDRTFLAMNGDVLSTLDYERVLAEHQAARNLLTIAAHRRVAKLDFGVLHTDASKRLTSFEEKPEIGLTVSMGVYVLEPEALALIPTGRPFDIPDLVEALLGSGQRVGVHEHDGYWRDIGRHDDYEEVATSWHETPLASRLRDGVAGWTVLPAAAEATGRVVRLTPVAQPDGSEADVSVSVASTA